MEDLVPPVALRIALPSDLNFIFSSWLKSFRRSLFAKNINNNIYFQNHHYLIEKLLQYSQIIVACDKDDQDQIYGYAVASKVDEVFTLHYIYVKHPYRKFGIAEKMLRGYDHDLDTVGCYTHDTYVAQKLAPKYNLVYHPYLMVVNEHDNMNADVEEEDVEISTSESNTTDGANAVNINNETSTVKLNTTDGTITANNTDEVSSDTTMIKDDALITYTIKEENESKS